MVLLTKLDGTKVLVNFENIKYFESTGDTRVIFSNGDTMIVKETLQEVKEDMVKLKASILQQANTLSDMHHQGI